MYKALVIILTLFGASMAHAASLPATATSLLAWDYSEEDMQIPYLTFELRFVSQDKQITILVFDPEKPPNSDNIFVLNEGHLSLRDGVTYTVRIRAVVSAPGLPIEYSAYSNYVTITYHNNPQ